MEIEPKDKISISHGLNVLQPSDDDAYPIPCKEWEFLKAKVNQINISTDWYIVFGGIFAGGALSTFIALFSIEWTKMPSPDKSEPTIALVCNLAVLLATLAISVGLFFLSRQQSKMKKVLISDVESQMDIISSRYRK